MLTERYHWTDYMIDAIDPGYRESLIAFIAAKTTMECKHRPKPRSKNSG